MLRKNLMETRNVMKKRSLAFFLLARAYALQSKASSSTSSTPSWAKAALQASEYFAEAKSILFVTGAGISAESGLPTYRGVSGLYNANGGETEEGYSIEECLSGAMYRQAPEVTWKYLSQIERSCRGVLPSRAHALVAATERNVAGRVTVMTQNIDGLHGRAGSTDVLALHGDLYRLQCTNCGHTTTVASYAGLEERASSTGTDTDTATFPPVCEKCGVGAIRPGVVLFDEFLGDETCQTYEDRLGTSMGNLAWTWQDSFLARRRGGGSYQREAPYDLSVVIGTSALFAYVNAAGLSGARTVEINPTRTSLSDLVDIYVPAKATEALEFVFNELQWQD